jgi:leucyl/phenylalanyl-tRNA---protein transferase
MGLTPDFLLRAYAMGVFPMAEGRDATEVHWVDPRHRGVLPLEGFHLSRSLARQIRRLSPRVTTDTAFDEVVVACAARDETWINADIALAYGALHRAGHAHSLEVWDGERLIGGTYGVVIGAAFFGESMFSHETGGSKMALAYLVHRLRAGGFQLFDTQFLTPHLASLGATQIPRADYHRRLAEALARPAAFDPPSYPPSPSPSDVLAGTSQCSTQTS